VTNDTKNHSKLLEIYRTFGECGLDLVQREFGCRDTALREIMWLADQVEQHGKVVDIKQYIQDTEEAIVLSTYETCGENISATARALNVERCYVRKRLKNA